jgi:hypothetical protein
VTADASTGARPTSVNPPAGGLREDGRGPRMALLIESRANACLYEGRYYLIENRLKNSHITRVASISGLV